MSKKVGVWIADQTTSLKPLQHVPQIIWLVEYILCTHSIEAAHEIAERKTLPQLFECNPSVSTSSKTKTNTRRKNE
jgi:hypothetical protein